MALSKSFSQRNRYGATPKEITIREDAPTSLRFFVLDIARKLDWGPAAVRPILCGVLRVPPDGFNWSEYPNIDDEVNGLMYGCPWYKVYDFVEELYDGFVKQESREHPFDPEGEENGKPAEFANALNNFFVEEGIGWQLVDAQIVARGSEAFEAVVKEAATALEATERPIAAKHMHEALGDLSRRPEADLPGAIYHALGALECVMRDLTGDSKATLGEAIKRYPGLLPKPLDEAVPKIWGYASNEARHILEGRETNREEAELLVGLSASLAGYLTRKQP